MTLFAVWTSLHVFMSCSSLLLSVIAAVISVDSAVLRGPSMNLQMTSSGTPRLLFYYLSLCSVLPVCVSSHLICFFCTFEIEL